MNNKIIIVVKLLLLKMFLASTVTGQELISIDDLNYLKGLTQSVIESSRIYPNQELVAPFGKNNTGGTLIRPGGQATYPAFWIRDYAMSLETGMVSTSEQRHMLLLTAKTQNDQTWISKGGSYVPFGAIADHIRVDDLNPIFFPGTYDNEEQGIEDFGRMPPYCDQFYFVTMAHYYWKTIKNVAFLKQKIDGLTLIDRLEIAFRVPPTRQNNELVYTTDLYRGKDFGFRDAIRITGDLSYSSILKYRAALQMADLFDQLQNKDKAKSYRMIAAKIKQAFASTFINSDGMVKASTLKSAQADVWGTALAIVEKLIEGEDAVRAAQHLAKAYSSGQLAYKGAIRHIIVGEDFSDHTAWEDAIVPKDVYQNGSYWYTPTGWVIYAIHLVDPKLASQLTKDYIAGLKESDYRKGEEFKGPLECFHPSGYNRGPVYMTSVSSPYIVLKTFTKKLKP